MTWWKYHCGPDINAFPLSFRKWWHNFHIFLFSPSLSLSLFLSPEPGNCRFSLPSLPEKMRVKWFIIKAGENHAIFILFPFCVWDLVTPRKSHAISYSPSSSSTNNPATEWMRAREAHTQMKSMPFSMQSSPRSYLRGFGLVPAP